MFKTILNLTLFAAIIMVACPAFAESMSFQLSVTIPPHAMPGQASITEQLLPNNTPMITQEQVIQREQITRNEKEITVQSVVVL